MPHNAHNGPIIWMWTPQCNERHTWVSIHKPSWESCLELPQRNDIDLPLNFLILPKELLTSMVYMGVEVTTCKGIYSDGVKVSVVACVPHWLTPPNGLWCTVDVVQPKPEFLVGIVLDDSCVVNAWRYHREDRELKDIDSNDYVLFRSWYLGFGWTIVLSLSKDMVLSHAPKFCSNTKH
jgi:hypothetical protein